MNNKTKTAIIGTAIVSLLGGSVYIGSEIGRPECDYVLIHEREKICITEEIKEIIEDTVGVSKGFGGIKFGDK